MSGLSGRCETKMVVKMEKIIQSKTFASISVALVIVLLAVIGYLILPKGMSGVGTGYQAVFLTNGQVYFGKIQSLDDKTVKMNKIYYLQTQIKVQPADITNANFSLVKLGSELHGPEDQMFITRSQVIFWENLKADSKVVQAINKAQK